MSHRALNIGEGSNDVLGVALLARNGPALGWCVPMMNQSIAFDVKAIWSTSREESSKLCIEIEGSRHPECSKSKLDVYYDCHDRIISSLLNSKPSTLNSSHAVSHENMELSLYSLARRDDIHALVVYLPPGIHADVIECLFRINIFKNVYSIGVPTLDIYRLQELLNLYNRHLSVRLNNTLNDKDEKRRKGFGKHKNRSNKSEENEERYNRSCDNRKQQPKNLPIWALGDNISYEASIAKLAYIVKDLGTIVGGEVHISSTLIDNSYCTREAIIIESIGISSVLRKLLGDVIFVSAKEQQVILEDSTCGGTLVGMMSFNGGASIMICINVDEKEVNSDIQDNFTSCDFSLIRRQYDIMLWGKKGHGQLRYDYSKKVFEVSRYLKHYEHPTFHPVTGTTNALKYWYRSIVENTVVGLSLGNEVVYDFTTAVTLWNSRGTNISIKNSQSKEESVETDPYMNELVAT